MVAFILSVYCVSIPVLLLFYQYSKTQLQYISLNIIAVYNCIQIAFSVHLAMQLYSLYQISRAFAVNDNSVPFSVKINIAGLALIMILPLFSLFAGIRKNRVFTACFCGLCFYFFPPKTWNLYDWGFKILGFGCMICITYSLLWLMKKLPSQLN